MGTRQEFIVYKDAIEASLTEQFSSLNGEEINIKVFEKFPMAELKKPAIVLGMPLMEKSPLKTDEEFWLRVNNSAYIVTSTSSDESAFDVQQLSTNLGNFIEANQWGIGANPADVTAIAPDIETLDPQTSNVQRIDFTQDLLIIDEN